MAKTRGSSDWNRLLERIRGCDRCTEHLPNPPRPVVQASPEARILIIGQAPGRLVHESGVPWNDPSGRRLREWLGVEDAQFYDAGLFALMPMGFCFPGTGSSGDLPPRPECAPEWHEGLLERMPRVELTVLLSRYALDHYLGEGSRKTLTETVRAWREFGPRFIPLPHPSPRNNRWLRKNPWMEQEVIPELRRRVSGLLESSP